MSGAGVVMLSVIYFAIALAAAVWAFSLGMTPDEQALIGMLHGYNVTMGASFVYRSVRMGFQYGWGK